MTPCTYPLCGCPSDGCTDALDKQREAVEEEPEEADRTRIAWEQDLPVPRLSDAARTAMPRGRDEITPEGRAALNVPDPDRWYDRVMVALSVLLVALLAYALWVLA